MNFTLLADHATDDYQMMRTSRLTLSVLVAALLAGYRLEHPLHEVWDERLPHLIAARAALMAAWSVADGHLGLESGSGAVVSVPRLLERLKRWGF